MLGPGEGITFSKSPPQLTASEPRRADRDGEGRFVTTGSAISIPLAVKLG
jgi:hypothetical protein